MSGRMSAKTCPADTLGVVTEAMASTAVPVHDMFCGVAEPNRYRLQGPDCGVVL